MGAPRGAVGIPTSMGAFAPGQEKAPAALRAAGLVGRLRAVGLAVVDHGDAPVGARPGGPGGRQATAWRPTTGQALNQTARHRSAKVWGSSR